MRSVFRFFCLIIYRTTESRGHGNKGGRGEGRHEQDRVVLKEAAARGAGISVSEAAARLGVERCTGFRLTFQDFIFECVRFVPLVCARRESRIPPRMQACWPQAAGRAISALRAAARPAISPLPPVGKSPRVVFLGILHFRRLETPGVPLAVVRPRCHAYQNAAWSWPTPHRVAITISSCSSSPLACFLLPSPLFLPAKFVGPNSGATLGTTDRRGCCNDPNLFLGGRNLVKSPGNLDFTEAGPLVFWESISSLSSHFPASPPARQDSFGTMRPSPVLRCPLFCCSWPWRCSYYSPPSCFFRVVVAQLVDSWLRPYSGD